MKCLVRKETVVVPRWWEKVGVKWVHKDEITTRRDRITNCHFKRWPFVKITESCCLWLFCTMRSRVPQWMKNKENSGICINNNTYLLLLLFINITLAKPNIFKAYVKMILLFHDCVKIFFYHVLLKCLYFIAVLN